jgi:hypothetical protein
MKNSELIMRVKLIKAVIPKTAPSILKLRVESLLDALELEEEAK